MLVAEEELEVVEILVAEEEIELLEILVAEAEEEEEEDLKLLEMLVAEEELDNVFLLAAFVAKENSLIFPAFLVEENILFFSPFAALLLEEQPLLLCVCPLIRESLHSPYYESIFVYFGPFGSGLNSLRRLAWCAALRNRNAKVLH